MKSSFESDWQSTADGLGIQPLVRDRLTAALPELAVHHQPTAEHCMRVGMSAVRIGQHAALPLKPLFYAGSMHDLGKLYVSQQFLTKTTEWTDTDRLALSHHPEKGYERLIDEGMIVTAGLVVRHHTFQPHSYPATVPEAPPYMTTAFDACARVVALADYYDAAHRSNSDGTMTGEEIREKTLAHNPDLSQLIDELYDALIFDTNGRPY